MSNLHSSRKTHKRKPSQKAALKLVLEASKKTGQPVKAEFKPDGTFVVVTIPEFSSIDSFNEWDAA